MGAIIRFYHSINDWLSGLPSAALSLILVGFAIFALIVAARGTPLVKAAVIAWFLFP